jgi:hypothetical protein
MNNESERKAVQGITGELHVAVLLEKPVVHQTVQKFKGSLPFSREPVACPALSHIKAGHTPIPLLEYSF